MYQQLTPYFGLILGLLPAFFAWVAVHVAGFLRNDALNGSRAGRLINTGIAVLTLTVCVMVSLLVSEQLTLNLTTDLQAFEIGFTTLAFGAMKPLMVQIQAVVGFTPQGFVLFPQQNQSAQTQQAQAQAATMPRIPVVQRPGSVTSNAMNPFQQATSPASTRPAPGNIINLYPDNGDHSG